MAKLMMFPLLRCGGCGKNAFRSIGACRWTLWRVSKLHNSAAKPSAQHAPSESCLFKLHWYIARIFLDFSELSKSSQPGYNFLKRMQPHQETPLRPILDADDDLWLDAARQLYPVLSRAQVPVVSRPYFVDLWAAVSVLSQGLLLPLAR